MEEKNQPEQTQEQTASQEKSQEAKAKTPWQARKEGWYDHIPLTLKQLDIIVGVCLTLLALTFIAIALDAMGIWKLFG